MRRIDDRAHTFRDRPPEGGRPCLSLDATEVEVRRAERIGSVAMIIAVGVNDGGPRRESENPQVWNTDSTLPSPSNVTAQRSPGSR